MPRKKEQFVPSLEEWEDDEGVTRSGCIKELQGGDIGEGEDNNSR
jgi:hypothetical protein